MNYSEKSAADEAIVKKQTELKKKRGLRSFLIAVLAAALTAYLIMGVFWGGTTVYGDSMSPELKSGDIAMFQRLSVTYRKNDIVVFTEEGQNYIKRIAALHGDCVDIDDGTGMIAVNGTVLDGVYPNDDESIAYPLTLGENQYFVLGDNSSLSLDSRNVSFGIIDRKDIKGRVFLILRKY